MFSPRNVTRLTSFFYESYASPDPSVPELHPSTLIGFNHNDEMLLGWGEIRVFPLLSMEVRIVYPKLAGAFENVVSLHMRSNAPLGSGFYVAVSAPQELYLSCERLDTFGLTLVQCVKGSAWSFFKMQFNDTLAAGSSINLGVLVNGKTPLEFHQYNWWEVRLQDIYEENVDVNVDVKDSDADVVIPGLYVERPFPPSLTYHATGPGGSMDGITLHIKFKEKTAVPVEFIQIEIPEFMNFSYVWKDWDVEAGQWGGLHSVGRMLSWRE